MPRNLELEQALLDAPEDLDGYRVYADWLEQQGDPRGKLIALQLAHEADARDERLSLVIAAHMRKHAGELLGPLAPRLGEAYCIDGLSTFARWRRGFVTSLTIDREWARESIDVLLSAAFEHPSAALLRDVVLRSPYPEHEHAVATLARAPRTLHAIDLNLLHPGSLEPLYGFGIEHVGLGTRFANARPDHAAVTLDSLARAPWRLTSLTLHLGRASISPEPLVALLAGDLPLTELQIWGDELRDATFAAAVTRALVRSPIVPRLARLTYRLGGMSRADNALLVDAGPQFTRLETVMLASKTYTYNLRARIPSAPPIPIPPDD